MAGRTCGHRYWRLGAAPGSVAVPLGGEVEAFVPAHEDLAVHRARLPEPAAVVVLSRRGGRFPLQVETKPNPVAPLAPPRLVGVVEGDSKGLEPHRPVLEGRFALERRPQRFRPDLGGSACRRFDVLVPHQEIWTTVAHEGSPEHGTAFGDTQAKKPTQRPIGSPEVEPPLLDPAAARPGPVRAIISRRNRQKLRP